MSKKRNLTVARLTFNLTGTLKNKFYDDVERMGVKEAKFAREIVRFYYDNKDNPNLDKNRF